MSSTKNKSIFSRLRGIFRNGSSRGDTNVHPANPAAIAAIPAPNVPIPIVNVVEPVSGDTTVAVTTDLNSSILSETMNASQSTVVSMDTVKSRGTANTGGTVNAGGTVNSGGTVNAGGTVNSGGTVNAGGTINSGGTTNAGGMVNADVAGGLNPGGTPNAGGLLSAGGSVYAGGSVSVGTGINTPSMASTTNTAGVKTSKLSIGLNGVHEILKVVKEASDMCSPLKSAVGGVVACIDAYKRSSGNHEEMDRLLKSIDRISLLIAEGLEHNEERTTHKRVGILARALEVERLKIEAMKNNGSFARLAQNTKDANDLIACYQSIRDALREFEFDLAMAVEKNSHAVLKNIVFQSLRRSDLAAFTAAINKNTVTRGPCTPGTRVDIIREIFDWAVNNDTSSTPVYWLNGLAGTGKTTIAYTMCQRLEAANIPFSSFFCSRQLDSRDSTLLIPTICRDLAELFHSYAAAVVPVLEKDSKLARAVLPLQMEKLLAGPWKASMPQREKIQALHFPIVIVDALDESDAGSEFLKELLRVVHDGALPGIKFLVTSRSDPDVVELCSTFPRGAVCHLHEVATKEVEEDITKFLVEKLPNLKGEPELETLAQRSGGLFIYAATVVRFLSPRNHLSAREQLSQLKRLLRVWPNSGGRREALLLDQLYEQILTEAFTYLDEDIQRERLTVLHAVLCVECPCSISTIAELVSDSGDCEMVLNVINSLHAAMYISSKDQCIYWYHQSFADFVFSAERANVALPVSLGSLSEARPWFNAHCDTPVCHALLATSCFRIMQELRFNICELESSFLLDSEVPNLKKRVRKKISRHLKYASLHWAKHLHQAVSSRSSDLYERVQDFLYNKLLFWIEALNLLDAKTFYHPQIYLLRDWLKQGPYDNLTEYVANILSFISHFAASPASLSTPHLYISTLAAWHPTSAIVEIWGPRFRYLPLFLYPEGMRALPLVTIPIPGESQQTTALAVSYDGSRIMSGSASGCIRVWDSTTGRQLQQVNGPSHLNIAVLALSHKGTHFVSRSQYYNLEMWDIMTGKKLHVLPVHCSAGTNHVVISHTDTYIVSGCNHHLEVWDIATGTKLRDLSDDSSYSIELTALAISFDDVYIIAGSANGSVRVWNAITGRQVGLFSHTSDSTVTAVAVSLNPICIISGSSDGSISIWDITTGNKLRQLSGLTTYICSMTVSHNDAYLVAVSDDLSVMMWNIATGEQLSKPIKPGHNMGNFSMTLLSGDSTHIVFGSDHFLKIWNQWNFITSENELKEPTSHTNHVNSVIFSHDDSYIVSGSSDTFIRIWDITTGEHLRQLECPDVQVTALTLSHNDTCIISGSHDGSVQVWNTITGKQKLNLLSHRTQVTAITVSPHDTYIVSGSCFIQVWDFQTGEALKQFNCGNKHIISLFVSPDETQIISVSDDFMTILWDLQTGVQVEILHNGHTNDRYVMVTHSFDCLIIASSNGSIRMQDMTGKLVRLLVGHTTQAITCLALSQDDTRIVAGSERNITVWDATTGLELIQLASHTGKVISMAFSHDNTRIVAGSEDYTVRVWELNSLFESDIAWVVGKDGWLTYDSQKLMWISTELRDILLHPYCTVIISPVGFAKVDFQYSKFGLDWHECYTP